MVDYQPFSGSYKGVMVQQNVVVAAGTMIKLGIAVGVSSSAIPALSHR